MNRRGPRNNAQVSKSSIERDRFPYPTDEWTLSDWFDAATWGQVNTREFFDVVISLWEDAPDEARAKVSWGTDPFNTDACIYWFKTGISNPNTAMKMLVGLGYVARSRGIRLLNGEHLRDHAEMFLRHVGHRFASLEADELRAFSRLIDRDVYDEATLYAGDRLYPLRERVYPQARDTLIGRDDDLARLMQALQQNVIVSLQEIGGQGKTSLAWMALRSAIQSEMVSDADWTTAKRFFLARDGRTRAIAPTGTLPLFDFQFILRSMCARFNWTDIMNLPEDRLAEACARKLWEGKYLIVVDNLETNEDYDIITKQMSDLLERGVGMQHSRVLITAREEIGSSGQVHSVVPVQLGGLEKAYANEFIQMELQHDQKHAAPGHKAVTMSEHFANNLVQLTKGNPQMLIVATAYYVHVPDERARNALLEGIRAARTLNEAFDYLFGETKKRMHQQAQLLAQIVADLQGTSDGAVISTEAERLYVTQGGRQAEMDYNTALNTLEHHRLIERIDAQKGSYAMHPLAQAYFRSRYRDR